MYISHIYESFIHDLIPQNTCINYLYSLCEVKKIKIDISDFINENLKFK